MTDSPPPPGPDLPDGTVTFLLTDVEGSTALWEQAPETMRTALARHDRLFEASVARHRGVHIRPRGEGDSRFAVFTSATDALSAALEIQHGFAAESWLTPRPIKVRIGVHTGEAELRDGDYYGSAVNRCARIRGIGHGGQTLASEATAALVRDSLPGGASLMDLGEHRLKDLSRPERIFQATRPDLLSNFPPLVSLDARPNNLPVQPTPLLGREREVAAVRDLLSRPDVRLVTLTGPGGTGKTRLSLQVAADLVEVMPDGAFFAELAPISDPRLVMPTVAQTLGVEAIGGRPALDAVADFLRERRILLLLDNFEQILPAADDVAALLRVCPGLKILVTSRAVLHLRGEHEYPVPPLALPPREQTALARELASYPALDLFVQRATEARPTFGATEESVGAIAEICRRLDGLPLAIELAAARVKLLAPPAMLARLERRLPLLTGGARDLPERQRTLRDTIAWSYDLLEESERRLFRRLAVFVGGCTLEAVEAVCDLDGDLGLELLDGISSLIDKSLLRQEDGPDGEPRFTMLETIREYGREQLQASGEEAAISRHHLAWACDVATRGQEGIHGSDGALWLDRLAADHDNFRAALAWSLRDTEPASLSLGLVMAGGMHQFWEFREHFAEARRWSEQLLQADDAARAGTRQGEAGSDLPPDHVDPSTPIRVGAFGVHPRVIVLTDLSRYIRELGDLTSAMAVLRASIELARRVGDHVGEAIAFTQLGICFEWQGDLEQSIALKEVALALARAVGAPFGLWHALTHLGGSYVTVDRGEQGRVLLEEALSVARTMGHPWGVNQALLHLGNEALRRGETARATVLLGESLEGWRAIGAMIGVRETCTSLGYASLATGNAPGAVDRFIESVRLCHEWSDRQRLGRSLQGMAVAAMTIGDEIPGSTEHMVCLLGAGRRLHGEMPTSLSIVEQTILEQTVAAARATLGDVAFEAAWSAGDAMSFDQICELADDLARQILGRPFEAPDGG